MINIKEKIADHWDANTCDYNKGSFEELDETRSKIYPYVEKELRMTALNNKRILEIGVGSAIEACTILRNTTPENYTLYDISPKTLERAKEHLTKHHPDKNINYIEGDMENMYVINNNSFDRVHALGSTHHTENTQKAFKEISRVLKPNGEFLFMLYCRDSFRYRVIIPLFIWRGKATRKKNIRTRDEWVRYLDGETNPIGIAYSKRQIKEFCKNAGLKIKHMKGHHKGFALYVYGIKNEY